MANRLDPNLLKKLSKRTGKAEKYLREQIAKRASRHRVSSEAYFVHWLTSKKIGAAKFRRELSPQIQGEILSLSGMSQSAAPTRNVSLRNRSAKLKIKVLTVRALQISPKAPLLSLKNIKDAKENAELYPTLFLFENSLREFIGRVLSQAHGPKWWKSKVATDVQKSVKDRMRTEKLNSWHGTRGATEIYYTDFSDLIKIFNRNAADFNPFFRNLPGGLSWITQKLKELVYSRNNIAHSAPLKKRDIDRFVIYFQDWYSQLDQLNTQIK